MPISGPFSQMVGFFVASSHLSGPSRPPIRETSFICTIVTWHGEGTAEATSADGLPCLYALTPFRERPGDGQIYVSFSIPAARAFVEVHRLLIRHLVGLVTVLTLAATRAFGHCYFLRQVRALVCATQRLAAGDLSPAPAYSQDLGNSSNWLGFSTT
jgi:hypothetical protein